MAKEKSVEEVKKASTKKENIHEGHRERLTNLAKSAGVDAMSDVQVVEFFLTYIFPRGDVNPLAHRLLDRFETFTQIIDADEQDLISVKGINERSAKKITMFGELFYYYTTAKMGKKYSISSLGDLISIIEDCLRFRTTENMILLALSAANIVTHKRRICANDAGKVGVSVLELTNFLASAKPAALAVGHCHPYGKASPSPNDIVAFNMIKNICETCGVHFIDSYIIGEDGVFSHREEKLIRFYYDVGELKEAFKSIIN